MCVHLFFATENQTQGLLMLSMSFPTDQHPQFQVFLCVIAQDFLAVHGCLLPVQGTVLETQKESMGKWYCVFSPYNHCPRFVAGGKGERISVLLKAE